MRFTGRQYAEINGLLDKVMPTRRTMKVSRDTYSNLIKRNGSKRSPLKLKDWKAYLFTKVRTQLLEDFFVYGTAITKQQGNTVRRVNPEKFRPVPREFEDGSVMKTLCQSLDNLQLAHLRLQNAIENNGNN